MSSDDRLREIVPQKELEVVEVEQETDHTKLMKVYERINRKIDVLIEKRKTAKECVKK